LASQSFGSLRSADPRTSTVASNEIVSRGGAVDSGSDRNT